MARNRHKEVLDRVVTILRTMDIPGVHRDEIRIAKFPFDERPSRGLCVSRVNESEGTGLNELDDIAYPVQLTRINHNLHPVDGISEQSLWRDSVRRRFNRKRIGVTGCELVTRSYFESIQIPTQWRDWNVDADVLRVVCLIRETRTL